MVLKKLGQDPRAVWQTFGVERPCSNLMLEQAIAASGLHFLFHELLCSYMPFAEAVLHNRFM